MDRFSVPVPALSLQETVSSGEYSSSRSMFDGLGSLSGRALFNFGKLTLKGIEQLIISRRLAIIIVNFPHQDADSIAGLHSMYVDLLELSRIHMYPKSMRIRALQILMRQIASRSTAYLLHALSTLPVVEIQMLLSEILSWFDPIRVFRGERDEIEKAVIPAYRDHLSKWEDHLLAPIIDFMRDFASCAKLGWSTVLSSGCLDLLLHLYISDFQEPVTLNSGTRSFRKSSITATCNSFLTDALADEYGCRLIELHPLRGLWPLWPMLAFVDTTQGRCLQRRKTWRLVGKEAIQWRISSIYDTLVLEWPVAGLSSRVRTTLTAEPFLSDLITDLLEFSGSSELDEETCFRALRSMHKLWSRLNTFQFRTAMGVYIERTSKDHARETLIRLVHRLILLSNRAPESDSFFAPCHQNCLKDTCPRELDGVIHFIHRLVGASKTNELLRQWLIDGDFLRLLNVTTARLYLSGALSSEGASDVDPEDPTTRLNLPRTTKGTRYRVLVLSMAYELLHENPEGIASLNSFISDPCDQLSLAQIFIQNSKPLWEYELRFFERQLDDWVDLLWLNPSVFRAKERDHRSDVYSWIK
ncbi:hypothetical protein GYMLUDRAFT_85069 [Collybiopsis luxurians FD-317 M1]|uniref:Uncharacterized protein n=1 Tax=Collybiopsis luxurians FD-317 M1 TaxID=944289 RepID=A0A0D0CES4_9AGAR|nr:hypothetical protein GYMLUDRAFT_85069 [Collybiopsis luxurians FD-317 M1]